jgi:hypothetical protein
MFGSGIVLGQKPEPPASYIGTNGTTTKNPDLSQPGTGPNNVNNEFGAGESSTIHSPDGLLTIKSPGNMQVVTDGNPPAISLGSSISKNIVINTFAGKGIIEGWYYETTKERDGKEDGMGAIIERFTDSKDIEKEVEILRSDFSDPKLEIKHLPKEDEYGGEIVLATYSYVNEHSTEEYYDHSPGNFHAGKQIEVSFGEHLLSRYGFFYPYTSTSRVIDVSSWCIKDDGVALVQFGGENKVDDEKSFKKVTEEESAPHETQGRKIIPYKRPTTVAIEGSNVFTELKIENVDWCYTTFNVNYKTEDPSLVYAHKEGPYLMCKGEKESDGHETYYFAASIAHLYYDVEWEIDTFLHEGQLLDGAIQLLKDSKVYVTEDIVDGTTNPQSASSSDLKAADKTTEALLVLPKENFELRVGGDFKPMDMYYEKDKMTANAYYTYEDFKTIVNTEGNVQGSSGKIYLYNKSVLGVGGEYSDKNAEIHTEGTNGDGNGMIEVGKNTVSNSKFHVYSGGYLKNLTHPEPKCEQINLSKTNAPKFTINHETEELYIVNDNENCCDDGSSINLLDEEGIGTIKTPLESTTNTGPLSIHANSGSVNFKYQLEIGTVKEHDFKVYSDHNKITTKDFSYTMQNGTLTLHTYENLTAPQNCRSSIIQGGDVKITQTGKTGNVKSVSQAREITNISQTSFPHFDTATVAIPSYGTTNSPLQIITVQGNVCKNDMDADRTGDKLEFFQTVIRAASDSYRATGSFELKTEDGGLLLQAGGPAGNGSVRIEGNLTLETMENADIAIQSVQDSVVIGKFGGTGVHTYDAPAGKESNFLLSGHTGVYIHGTSLTTQPKGNQNIVIASEDGVVWFDAKNSHKQGPTGHYLVYGNTGVDFAKDNVIDMSGNKTTSDYAKLWSPGGWVRSGAAFTYTGSAHVPLTILAEGGAHGAGTPESGVGGSVSFDGVTRITNLSGSDAITQIMSKNENVNIKNDFTFTNTASGAQSGHLLIQAGTDIYTADNDKTLQFDHYGDGQIIMEAHRDIDLSARLAVNLKSPTTGEFTMKAGYKGASKDGILFTDTSYIRQSGKLTDYTDYAQDKTTGHGNISFKGDAAITVSSEAFTSAAVINAYRSIYINGKFGYLTKSLVQAENHSINHLNPGISAGNLLLYAETGNVETGNSGTVLITVEAADNNGDIRIQAGPYLCSANSQFDEDHGNILFGKPLTIDNAGSGYTILQAHRDIEIQTSAPATFIHTGKADADTAVMLVAGRHIETHSPVTFDYNQNAKDGSITLWAGRMDHPGGLNVDADWACTDALCKTAEEGSNLTLSDPQSAMSGGKGNGSILLFDALQFNYSGDSTLSLLAFNGNIESDPYLHKKSATEYTAPIIINHKGTGLTQLKAIDIKLHDRFEYNGASAADSKNGRLYIQAYDSILTRKVKYVNHEDTGSVYITTAKYKNVDNQGCDGPDDCATGGPGIRQGHIVLGYGADCANGNENDSILFDYNRFGTNKATAGGNVHILAGFEGFEKNSITKGFGGNITFDRMAFYMPTGNGSTGGYAEIRTPNGNIWGKDSLLYRGINGNFLVDAGRGSEDDPMAVRWDGEPCTGGTENILNTRIPDHCGEASWRTGNIMMKGATLNFGTPDAQAIGTGNAVFRTREGFIDTYDAFTADSMAGHLLKYAGMESLEEGRTNSWGDVSERDFRYTPVEKSGSVFFGADDNIMLNYGNSNLSYPAYGNGGMGYPSAYDVTGLNDYSNANPYYYTPYESYIDNVCAATFDVNADGYMFYRSGEYRPLRNAHRLYRGCADCSGTAGDCRTTSNGARDLVFNFDRDARGAKILSGGLAAVASNYIDLFTKFTYMGGEGSALGTVPGMGDLHGEDVSGYGLYIKSQFNGEGGNSPEKRRATCETCGSTLSQPIGNGPGKAIPEMTYIGFHDDARIHTHGQKSLLEAPVIEFFGHAELDTETGKGSRTNITLKGDSLIFHDSVIFDGGNLRLEPFTTDADLRANDMRYGVINDRGTSAANYSFYGPAIEMTDRGLPVLELGYQRCIEPGSRGLGDVVVAFKHGYTMPIFNTVVANNARISFMTGMAGGDYADAFVRTDLLRIRNKVEFYTDLERTGKFVPATPIQMDGQKRSAGMYMRHLHMEPGSELSIPDEEGEEDALIVISSTVAGGYGNIHETVFVKGNGILAPGFASLMESDCQTPYNQGTLTVQNLQMEKDAILRVSVRSSSSLVDGVPVHTTLADMVHVTGKIFTFGKIPIVVLPETQTLEPGCYRFITYDDKDGESREYVKNFVLEQTRYGDFYFALDFSEDGVVSMCVTTFPMPTIQRSVDLPSKEGVTTNLAAGRHYVGGHKNFTFTAAFSGTPLKVTATGFYSQQTVDLDKTAKVLAEREYEYTIYQVVEPQEIEFGPESSSVSNEGLDGQRVWAYRNTLYISATKVDVISIHNLTGVLYKKIEIPEGITRFTLEKGIYIVTLKDGSAHKVFIF